MDGNSGGLKALAQFDDIPNNSTSENLNLEGRDQGDDYYYPSDCESVISGTDKEQLVFQLSDKGLIRMAEGDKIYDLIKKKLVTCLSFYGFNAQVETIQRNDYSSVMNRARHISFGIYAKAMEIKCGGNANVKYAWYGASKDEIEKILFHGFGLPKSTGINGYGVYLSPVDHPVERLDSLVADEDGLKHVLLCRVLLGRMEAIPPGSGQYNPSSDEFDSGVDNLETPKRYIIWSSSMNTRILPEFVVSFRTSSNVGGCQRIPQPVKLPNSDWMPFTTLIHELSKLLPLDSIKLIFKHYSDHKKQRITRRELIQRVRLITGDKLLVMIIRSHREKIKASRSCSAQQLNERSNLLKRMD